MKFNLKEVREEIYHAEIKEFAKFAGIGEAYYSKYEEKGEIPSKYIYNLWQNLKDFPIPSDFFIYTSATLQANMTYHHLKQEEVRKMFGFQTQTTISKYMYKNCPMYELKHIFLQFNPLIVPFQVIYEPVPGSEECDIRFAALTDLTPSGNLTESFMSTSNKKKEKQTTPVSV